MRRLSLPFVLGLAAVACGGGAGSPAAPTPPRGGFPGKWSGSISLSTNITGDQPLVIVSEGSVVWSRDDDGEVTPLGGATLYTPSLGHLSVTLHNSAGFCSEQGVGSFSFGAADGTLIVQPSGAYDLTVKSNETTPFPTQVSCGPNTVTRPAETIFFQGFTKHLTMVDGRIKGGWSKVEGNATYAAVWDFTAN
jgi:hypothetical protein